MSKDKNGKRVQVVDKTGDKAPKAAVKVETAQQSSVDAILATLSPEQREEMKKALGVKAASKKNGENKGAFEAAAVQLCGKVQAALAEEKFPAAFCIEFGRDSDGAYFCNTSRVRQKYGPRKGKEDPAPAQS